MFLFNFNTYVHNIEIVKCSFEYLEVGLPETHVRFGCLGPTNVLILWSERVAEPQHYSDTT